MFPLLLSAFLFFNDIFSFSLPLILIFSSVILHFSSLPTEFFRILLVVSISVLLYFYLFFNLYLLSTCFFCCFPTFSLHVLLSFSSVLICFLSFVVFVFCLSCHFSFNLLLSYLLFCFFLLVSAFFRLRSLTLGESYSSILILHLLLFILFLRFPFFGFYDSYFFIFCFFSFMLLFSLFIYSFFLFLYIASNPSLFHYFVGPFS